MTASIDPSDPLPLYVQLKSLLVHDILAGKYSQPGRLPTEHELSATYSLSRTPVHRALAELAAEGVIVRQRRNGTFVDPGWLERNRTLVELRVVVPEGPWETLVRAACPPQARLSVVAVGLEDLHPVLIQAVAEGRAPDVALLDSVWVPEFAASGFLYPLEELDARWLQAEYLPDVVEPFRTANQHQGRIFAIQAEADVAGLWYRRDDLAQAGLRPPRTWKGLVAAATVLRGRGVAQPLVMPTGTRGGETTTYCLGGLLAANGGSLLKGEQVTLDSATTRECLAMLADLAAQGLLPTGTVDFAYDQGARLLARGDAAMLIGGSYEMSTLSAETGLDAAEVWQHFGFVAPPRGPRRGVTTLAGGMVHGIFRQARHPELAMALLRRLSAPEALAEMSRRTGQLASRGSGIQIATVGSPFLQQTAALLAGAAVRPATRAYPRVSAQIQQMVESVLLGQLDPAAAAARAADMVAAITGLPVRGDR